MSGFEPIVGNVAEAGDIVLFALVLVVTPVVGLALFGIDAVVGRLGRLRRRRAGEPAVPSNPRTG